MERWLPIFDFPDYEVSSLGRIRNIKTGRLMRTYQNSRGYVVVCLRKNKQQYTKRVHRLVAEAFYDCDDICIDDLDVNHIDGCKTNNFVGNLEFCTRQENIKHAFDNGLKHASRRIKIRVIETGEIYESIRECSRYFECDPWYIRQCLKDPYRTFDGFHFEEI